MASKVVKGGTLEDEQSNAELSLVGLFPSSSLHSRRKVKERMVDEHSLCTRALDDVLVSRNLKKIRKSTVRTRGEEGAIVIVSHYRILFYQGPVPGPGHGRLVGMEESSLAQLAVAATQSFLLYRYLPLDVLEGSKLVIITEFWKTPVPT